ncbi:hypothetical protein MYX76_16645 [Desulfobacterota bacterium AH_259_B03_O07]|nr:hypothetical protein [Desulfobacterota bacterium AH_259_B03_O07]
MSKEIEVISKVLKKEWYQILIDDCRAILTERIYNSRHELILGKGEIGERIYNDPNYKKETQSNKKINEQVAKDIGLSDRDIRRCIQFYKWVKEEYEKITKG